MSDNILSGKEYLKKKLLPLMSSIEIKKSDSSILKALGLEGRNSSQSINIQFGIHIETFWNKVISDSEETINLIERSNMVLIEGRKRKQDHLFKVGETYYYLESKCNLTFDSEKKKASNQKVNDITKKYSKETDKLITGYFNPVVPIISNKVMNAFHKKGIYVFGVEWMCGIIKVPFTEKEYFDYLQNDISSILLKKGL